MLVSTTVVSTTILRTLHYFVFHGQFHHAPLRICSITSGPSDRA